MKRLAGKVALITGGNSGIGLATAECFAAEGAQVIITARRQAVLDQAVRRIGHGACGLVGDVADLSHHQSVAAWVKGKHGRLDVYMANAGVLTLAPSSAVSAPQYDEQFNTNARGVFFGVQAMAPLMGEGGSIILTSSLAASRALQGHAVYAGSKAAIEAFARHWVTELRDRKVGVNVISPGPVDTGIVDKLGVAEADRPAFIKAMTDAIPAGRFGYPSEVARAALYLASDESLFVNGARLSVDGGMSMG